MGKMPHFSFKAKALLLLGGLQCLGLLALGFLGYKQSQEILERLALEKLELALEKVSADLANFLGDESRLVLLLAQVLPVEAVHHSWEGIDAAPENKRRYEQSVHQLEQLFMATAPTHPHYLELSYLNNAGQELVRIQIEDQGSAPSRGEALHDHAGQPYFRQTSKLARGQVYISPFVLDENQDLAAGRPTPGLWVATPIFDESGQRLGVLTLYIDPSALLALIKNPFEQGRIYLVDQRGFMVYASNHSKAKSVDPSPLADIHPRLAGLLASGVSDVSYAACELEPPADKDSKGDYCIHGFHKLNYNDNTQATYRAIVFDAQPDVVFSPAAKLRDRFIQWGSIVLGLGLALTFFLSRSVVVNPILHLGEVAGRIASGDLRPQIAPYDQRKDEIGQLYTSFNTMVEKLSLATEHLQEEVQARTAELQISEAHLERQNRELERLSAYKSHLLSVVSHELKTPLTALDGFSRTINQIQLTDAFLQQFDPLQKGVLEKVRHRIEVMEHNTARLIRLVNDILDFSRIDQGRSLVINRQRVDLGQIVRESVEACGEMARNKGLAVRYEGPLEPENLWAMADGDRIGQVLNNLLGNALKFTDSGEGIRLRADYVGDYLEFQVHDSGEGIDKDALERIFELFEQAGSNVSRKQGTGIGLAISKYIAERHEGYIRAQSDGLGKGSCFIFGIPRYAA